MKKFVYIFIAAGVISLFTIAAGIKGEAEITKKLHKQFIEIPEGIVIIGKDSVKVPAFRLGKAEVTNAEYIAFLNDLKAEGKDKMYEMALPDTNAWKKMNILSKKYIQYYLRHKAYADYPVVNVSYEGAQMYCNWLTDKYNIGKQEKEYVFRLPTRAEWLSAARAGDQHRNYAWETPFLQDENGDFLANFRRIRNSQISESGSNGIELKGSFIHPDLILSADITAPAKSYQPGIAGLYNLNGNVAEMVAEPGLAVGGSWINFGYDIRNDATMEFDSPSPTVGFRVLMEEKSE